VRGAPPESKAEEGAERRKGKARKAVFKLERVVAIEARRSTGSGRGGGEPVGPAIQRQIQPNHVSDGYDMILQTQR
jgi:hypothetical protein